MFQILRADLLVLANTFRTKAGAVALAGWFIVAGGVGLGSLGMCDKFLLNASVLDFLREAGEPAFALLVGFSFLPALMLGFSLALSQTRTDLVTSPAVEQLLVAPLSRTSILARTLVRALFSTFTFQLAAGLAWIGPVALKLGYSPLALGAYLLACLILAVPLLAVAILVQVLGLRFLSSPRKRLVLSVLSGGISIVVSALWFSGLITGGDQGERIVDLLETRLALPSPLSGAAALVSKASGLGGQAGDGVRILLAFFVCLVSWPLLALAARLLPGALDASKGAAERPIVGRGTFGSASWPERPLPSILRKELAETLQVRSSLGAYLVITGFVFILVKSNLYSSSLDTVGDIPATILHLGGLLSAWMILLLMLSMLQVIGVVASMEEELSLLATSPVSRRALLFGKCVSIGLPLAWLWIATPIIALFANGTPVSAVLLFLLIGLPIVLLVTTFLAAVATWPTLRRIVTAGIASEVVTPILPALAVMVGVGAVFYAVVKGRFALMACYAGHGPFMGQEPETVGWLMVAAAWGLGLVLPTVFFLLGVRNTRVNLDPQP